MIDFIGFFSLPLSLFTCLALFSSRHPNDRKFFHYGETTTRLKSHQREKEILLLWLASLETKNEHRYKVIYHLMPTVSTKICYSNHVMYRLSRHHHNGHASFRGTNLRCISHWSMPPEGTNEQWKQREKFCRASDMHENDVDGLFHTLSNTIRPRKG